MLRSRPVLPSLIIADAAAVALVIGYVAVGVDSIDQYYICYFSWADAWLSWCW